MDVPVIPGLGLYLDELFFDKYNVKLDYEMKKLESAAQNREAKRQRRIDMAAETAGDNAGAPIDTTPGCSSEGSGESRAVVTEDNSTSGCVEGDEKEGGGGGGEDPSVGGVSACCMCSLCVNMSWS